MAFDPLDGSSIVDTNFSVGTIFGVWPGDKLIGVTGRDQVEHFLNIHHNLFKSQQTFETCGASPALPGRLFYCATTKIVYCQWLHVVCNCIYAIEMSAMT